MICNIGLSHGICLVTSRHGYLMIPLLFCKLALYVDCMHRVSILALGQEPDSKAALGRDLSHRFCLMTLMIIPAARHGCPMILSRSRYSCSMILYSARHGYPMIFSPARHRCSVILALLRKPGHASDLRAASKKSLTPGEWYSHQTRILSTE